MNGHKRLASKTKSELPSIFEENITQSGVDTRRSQKVMTILDVLRCPPLRRIALIMGFVFLAVTIAYYGHC